MPEAAIETIKAPLNGHIDSTRQSRWPLLLLPFVAADSFNNGTYWV